MTSILPIISLVISIAVFSFNLANYNKNKALIRRKKLRADIFTLNSEIQDQLSEIVNFLDIMDGIISTNFDKKMKFSEYTVYRITEIHHFISDIREDTDNTRIKVICEEICNSICNITKIYLPAINDFIDSSDMRVRIASKSTTDLDTFDGALTCIKVRSTIISDTLRNFEKTNAIGYYFRVTSIDECEYINELQDRFFKENNGDGESVLLS